LDRAILDRAIFRARRKDLVAMPVLQRFGAL